MKKYIGLLIAFIGICTVFGALFLTPNHALDAGDSGNGTSASAPLFFSALIIFGAGVVIYASSIPRNSEKRAE